MTVGYMLGEEEYVHQAYTELNPLTGLYYNHAFFKEADKFIKNLKDDTYSMVAIDIEHFRLFNKIYGREAGDELIVYIADCLKSMAQERKGIAGYLGADNFCLLMPDDFELMRRLEWEITRGIRKWSDTVGYLPALGVYVIDDTSVPVMQMYDRATMVLAQAVGDYTKRIKYYDSSMEEKIEEEINLLSDIQRALREDEFTFYAQPQYDIAEGKIVGAEALVRWNHSEKGLIPPSVFIPVLEKNGLIADLDRYVWRKVCMWLRDWIDRGYSPVPISINVSRLDIFSMDVPAYLLKLIMEYGLTTRLLKVEITESAYTESGDKIIRAVKDLRAAGFLVMMDDFGSGYSSLNMLKEVSVDVLKLDMRFLDMKEHEREKGISIIETIVNMAHVMGVPIVAEGVENEKQEYILKELGCRYTQGYYYYRPLPIPQLEELLADEHILNLDGIWRKQIEPLHVREFLDDNLFNDTMINNVLGAIAFYELHENGISITRVNDQYYKLVGIPENAKLDDKKMFWNHVRDDDRTRLHAMFLRAYEKPLDGACDFVHFIRADGEILWVYMRVFFLQEYNGRRMFYGSLVDMTDTQKKETHLPCYDVMDLTAEQQASMEEYYGDIPCGYTVAKILVDGQRKPCGYEIVFANQQIQNFCGGNGKQLRMLIRKIFGTQAAEALQKAYRAAYFGEVAEHLIHIPITSRYMQLTFYQYRCGYVACMLQDVTYMQIYSNTLDSVMQCYREVYFVNFQDDYCRMIYPNSRDLSERGNYDEMINRHFGNGKILRHDEEGIRKFLSTENMREVLRVKDAAEYRYRRSGPDAAEEWCLTNFTVRERDENGVPQTAIVTIRSLEQEDAAG